MSSSTSRRSTRAPWRVLRGADHGQARSPASRRSLALARRRQCGACRVLMSTCGRLRQIAERSRSLSPMSRRVAHLSSRVKVPALERAPAPAAQRRKPTHFLQADPLPTFELCRTGHWLFRGRNSRQTGSRSSRREATTSGTSRLSTLVPQRQPRGDLVAQCLALFHQLREFVRGHGVL